MTTRPPARESRTGFAPGVVPARKSLPRAGALMIPVAIGELMDKITILEIKEARIAAAHQRENVRTELHALRCCLAREMSVSAELEALQGTLREINERLWDIENGIRECERRQCFDNAFVELARSVYRLNDRRAAIKRQINLLTASDLIEEKSYTRYD